VNLFIRVLSVLKTISYSSIFEICELYFSCHWHIRPDLPTFNIPHGFSLPCIGYINPLYPPLISLITSYEEYRLLDPNRTQLCLFCTRYSASLHFESDHAIPVIALSADSQSVLETLSSRILKIFQTPHIEHGVMMECFGKGILLLGKSGVGKSEAALQLLARHHRLISDDCVRCYRLSPFEILATADPRLKNLLEIRGVGVINVHQWYGALSTVEEKKIDLVITLDPDLEDPRPLKNELGKKIILGVSLPHKVLPLAFKRDLAMLIESTVKFVFSPSSMEIDSLLSPA
jgi:hypothetical protein